MFTSKLNVRAINRLQPRIAAHDLVYLLLLVVLAVLAHGYHYGIEDQAINLPSFKQHLNPALYPHDSQFFAPQNQPTVLPVLVAGTVRITHVSTAWIVFIWHLVSLFLLLLGSLMLVKRFFWVPEAQWAGVLLVTVLLTIGVAGTSLYLADQYLHPRTPATAVILFALVAFLDKRWLPTIAWLLIAAAIHIQMAFYGLLLMAFLLPRPRTPSLSVLALAPFGELFEPPNPAWREASRTNTSHYLLQWQWYEWLGVFAPLAILYGFAWWKAREAARLLQAMPQKGNDAPQQQAALALRCAWFCRRLLSFGAFLLLAAAVTTIPPQLERLTPYQPLRGYHLLYLFLFLFMGALLGERVLDRKLWRWIALFLPLALGMFYAQRQLFPGSRHIEWPGLVPRNAWLQAFDWVAANTPADAYFVLDPRYMDAVGEDKHGFRGLAERSQMADWVKDTGPVTLFPAIGPEWQRQVHALDGFERFQAADFRRLHDEFGVNWAVLQTKVDGLECPYQNASVRVCRIQ